jgi:hypothetical protein
MLENYNNIYDDKKIPEHKTSKDEGYGVSLVFETSYHNIDTIEGVSRILNSPYTPPLTLGFETRSNLDAKATMLDIQQNPQMPQNVKESNLKLFKSVTKDKYQFIGVDWSYNKEIETKNIIKQIVEGFTIEQKSFLSVSLKKMGQGFEKAGAKFPEIDVTKLAENTEALSEVVHYWARHSLSFVFTRNQYMAEKLLEAAQHQHVIAVVGVSHFDIAYFLQQKSVNVHSYLITTSQNEHNYEKEILPSILSRGLASEFLCDFHKLANALKLQDPKFTKFMQNFKMDLFYLASREMKFLGQMGGNMQNTCNEYDIKLIRINDHTKEINNHYDETAFKLLSFIQSSINKEQDAVLNTLKQVENNMAKENNLMMIQKEQQEVLPIIKETSQKQKWDNIINNIFQQKETQQEITDHTIVQNIDADEVL